MSRTATKNLTLSIDADLLDKARVLAAIRRTSVNEMVRGFLASEIAREQQSYDAAAALSDRTPSSAPVEIAAPDLTASSAVSDGSGSAKSVRLAEKLGLFDDRWSPKTIATYNANDVMVVKVEGAFNWHKHDDTDDFFHVLAGCLEIDIEGEETRTLYPGDICIVPKGRMHRPRTVNGVVHLLLIEPSATPNTGDAATAAPRQFL
jgi:mannose-6-phosphate isomerase-like protein (cupin superfamily)